MAVETDAQGRLYLSASLREKYGQSFHVVEYEDHIELIPIDDDPLQAARDEVGDALANVPRDKLRADALETAKQEATDDLDQSESGDNNQPDSGDNNQPDSGDNNQPDSGDNNQPDSGNTSQLESGDSSE